MKIQEENGYETPEQKAKAFDFNSSSDNTGPLLKPESLPLHSPSPSPALRSSVAVERARQSRMTYRGAGLGRSGGWGGEAAGAPV